MEFRSKLHLYDVNRTKTENKKQVTNNQTNKKKENIFLEVCFIIMLLTFRLKMAETYSLLLLPAQEKRHLLNCIQMPLRANQI